MIYVNTNATGGTRCSGVRAEGGLSLPVVSNGGSPRIRRSRNSGRRAAVLVGVHVVILAHVAHYLAAGRTLSPVEPSESMYTLELGQINAGAIFFALALLSTLIFGRFVCGWGCHLIAYQDFCGWLMKKMHIKPKPFRSRLLVYVPLILALYMFVWPAAKRALFAWPAFEGLVSDSPVFLQFVFGTPPSAFPGFGNHLMTTALWKTLPGPVFGVLTILVCGFAAVYFLGSKGFCTYGCPYGGLFGLLDKASVGKIRVTDACEQCGHCTATCTSNVRVHQEVNLYGMVVDPGCMKCLDCVSVCPNDALYFGFSAPSLFKGRPRRKPPPRRYDFTVAEELLLVALFGGATLAFRGLYDGPPLLMSVALAGVTAYVALKLLRLLGDPTVRLQNLRLKTAGRLGRGGWVFVAVTVVWLAFTAHSGFVQWHRAWGKHFLNLTEAGEEVLTGEMAGVPPYSPLHYQAIAESFRHLTLADRWGLRDVVEIKRGLAWLALSSHEDERAVDYLRQAMEVAAEPATTPLYEHLTVVLVHQGRVSEAIEVMQELFEMRPPTAVEHFRLAGLLAGQGRVDEAIEQYVACLELAPDSAEAHYNLGGLLGRNGRFEEAVKHLSQALRRGPNDVDTHIELALAYVGAGNVRDGIVTLRRAIQIAPHDPRPQTHLDALLRRQGGTSDK